MTAPWVQGQLFGDGAEQPRSPGWHLVAGPSADTGWHIVDRSNPDRSVTTVCGVVGHVIQSDAQTIMPCAACAATEPS